MSWSLTSFRASTHSNWRSVRDVVEVDFARLAEAPDLLDGVAERVDERFLLLDRKHGLAEGSGARVDRERLVEIAQDIDVADDQAVVLAGEDAVGPRDRLHQRLVAHGLVEVDGRARRHVEPGGPHGADECDAQRVLGVLESALQVLLDHPLADRPDVDSALGHLGDLVLRLRDHDRHVGAAHEGDLLLEEVALVGVELPRCQTLLVALEPRFPGGLHLQVGADGRRLVDRDDHRLARKAAAEKVVDDVLRDPIEAILAGDQLVLLTEEAGELALLLRIEVGPLDDVGQVLVEAADSSSLSVGMRFSK